MSDQAKLTPGPWIVYGADADGTNDVLPAMRPGHIALDIFNAADARLIAAAPDLLTCLLALHDWARLSNDWRPDTTLARKVSAAISKALNTSGEPAEQKEAVVPK